MSALVDRHLEADARGHVEADGERVEVRQRLRRQGRDAAGIHAAREVGADRDIGDQLAIDGLAKQPVEFFEVLLVRRAVEAIAEVEVPVALRPKRARLRGQEDAVPGSQQLHSGEQRAVGEDVLEGEVLEQMRQAHRRSEPVMLQQRLDLRAEDDHGPDLGVVQRLDAVSITREEQLTPTPVPDGEREHAVEALDAFGSPVRIGVEHDLGVGVGSKGAPLSLQLEPQLAVVVELAVVGDDVVAGGIDHRLVALGPRIDDREAAIGEPDRPVGVLTLAIRAAVGDDVAHAPKQRYRDRSAGAVQRARYATHSYSARVAR